MSVRLTRRTRTFTTPKIFMGLGDRASGAVMSATAEQETAERLGARALAMKVMCKAREAWKHKAKAKPGPKASGEQ